MKSEVTDLASRPGVWSCILVLCLTAWIGCFAVGFGLAVPQFASLFQEFGAQVSPLTEFVLRMSNQVWGLLLLGFVVQFGFFVFLLAARTSTARRTALIGSGANIAGELVLAVALYSPIIKLGAVV